MILCLCSKSDRLILFEEPRKIHTSLFIYNNYYYTIHKNDTPIWNSNRSRRFVIRLERKFPIRRSLPLTYYHHHHHHHQSWAQCQLESDAFSTICLHFNLSWTEWLNSWRLALHHSTISSAHSLFGRPTLFFPFIIPKTNHLVFWLLFILRMCPNNTHVCLHWAHWACSDSSRPTVVTTELLDLKTSFCTIRPQLGLKSSTSLSRNRLLKNSPISV